MLWQGTNFELEKQKTHWELGELAMNTEPFLILRRTHWERRELEADAETSKPSITSSQWRATSLQKQHKNFTCYIIPETVTIHQIPQSLKFLNLEMSKNAGFGYSGGSSVSTFRSRVSKTCKHIAFGNPLRTLKCPEIPGNTPRTLRERSELCSERGDNANLSVR